jgi:large subunit ribosomal protein L16
MLIPRKVKFRKQHHPGRSGHATGGTKVSLIKF